MKGLQIIVVVLAACILLSCKKNAPTFAEKVDAVFQNIPAHEPGAAVLIAKGDRIIFLRGYGIADITTKEPITGKTLFNLGSISKTFVANAILMLQEQHKLSVEDSLALYFPYFKDKAIARKVKIKHLLSHTSGLPDNRNFANDTVFYLTALDSANWYPVTQTDTLVFEPGSNFEYSNPAFNGLALIVEKVSGMKWQKYIEQNIFVPAGMATSTITDGPHPSSGVSHAYNFENGKWIEDDYGEEPTFPAAGNGGVWSSVEELFKYERALQRYTFISKESLDQSRTVFKQDNWASTRPPEVGWSWFIATDSSGLKTIGHTGTQGGYTCNYVTIPQRDIQVVILCNTPRDVAGFTQKLIAIIKSGD